jgi:septal ring factor EnvC (AmiA/AmiB activator)
MGEPIETVIVRGSVIETEPGCPVAAVAVGAVVYAPPAVT